MLQRTLAALLFAAVPLNAQVIRVAAPTFVPSAPLASAVLTAPLLAAPSLTAPAVVGSPTASPAAALIPSTPAPAAPTPKPLAASSHASVKNAADVASDGRAFDGVAVTRSGSIFAPSRTPQAAVPGGVAFVRVHPAPAAPVKPVPDAQGLHGPALLERVGRIAAKGQTEHGYHEASMYLFATADNHTLNGVHGVADAYSGVFVPGTSPEGRDYSETGDKTHDGWSRTQSLNVEHVFPQSLFKKKTPMRSDLHHLMATFEHPNGVRGNLPFGVAQGALDYHNDAGAKRDGRVFEPPDFTKGRVARALLYFYSRYKDEAFFDQDAAAFWNPQIETLLDWNRRFPPTVEERTRNDQVQAFQGNRNPFVDDPGLADRIGAEALRSLSVSAAPKRRSDRPRKGGKRKEKKRKNRLAKIDRRQNLRNLHRRR